MSYPTLTAARDRRALLALALVLPVMLLAGAASAQRSCAEGCEGSPFPDCCGGRCTNLDNDRSNCGSCGTACPPGQICYRRQCASPEPPVRCDPPCGPGQLCIGGTTCCDRDRFCGGVCLAAPARQCEPSGTGIAARSWCCPADQTCCGNGNCCPPGHTCCSGGNCCPTGSVCCGNDCCDAGTSCLSGSPDPATGSSCCPLARVCADECCWADTECVNGECWPRCGCPSGQICVDRGDPAEGRPPTCCPAGQVWDVGFGSADRRGLCCPPENRWVHREGRGQNAGTTAECCPPEHQWEEGLQCCPPERRGGANASICCPEGQRWQGARCESVCKDHEPQLCRDECCRADATCCDYPIGIRCCEAHSPKCCFGRCCPASWDCCPPKDGDPTQKGVCLVPGQMSSSAQHCGSCWNSCPEGSICKDGRCHQIVS